jgi:hypothetical protein
MSYLIDSYKETTTLIDGYWYIAKPLAVPFVWRVRDAWKVLWNRAQAVHFMEDVVREQEKTNTTHRSGWISPK